MFRQPSTASATQNPKLFTIMHIDFHHAVTYVCARHAGYGHDEAAVIAHAAQYVDDATNTRGTILLCKAIGNVTTTPPSLCKIVSSAKFCHDTGLWPLEYGAVG